MAAEGYRCKEDWVQRDAKRRWTTAVKRNAISGRNILSNVKEEGVTIHPKIGVTVVPANTHTHCESQQDNPYQFAVNRQRNPKERCPLKEADQCSYTLFR
jgi:hypothetical protein